MKKFKDNKGITGIDITASIVVIIIAVGIIATMYSKYINNSKQIRRNTEANNLGMSFMEYIEKTDFDTIYELFEKDNVDEDKNIIEATKDDFYEQFGMEIIDSLDKIPSGYKIRLIKQEKIKKMAMQLNLEIFYNISAKEEKITFSTVKTKLINPVNLPDMKAIEIKDATIGENLRYTLKYSNLKKGYAKAKISDYEGYGISGKRYPIAVYAKEDAFDINGVVNFEKCEEIYIWVPRFGKLDTGEYVFCYDTTNYPIKYGTTKNSLNDVNGAKYSINEYVINKGKTTTYIPTEFEGVTGKWVKVNSDLIPIDETGKEIIDENNILNILDTQTFTWE